jgi:hypothetical protein
MSLRLVRLAILAYPGHWRRRYGAEIENLTVAVLTDQQTSLGRGRILFGLVAHGFDERFRTTEATRVRATLTTTAAVLATFAIASGVASDSLAVPNAALSTSVRFGVGVSVQNGGHPTGGRPGQRRVVVTVPKREGSLISVSRRSAVVINPKSGEVLSVASLSKKIRIPMSSRR